MEVLHWAAVRLDPAGNILDCSKVCAGQLPTAVGQSEVLAAAVAYDSTAMCQMLIEVKDVLVCCSLARNDGCRRQELWVRGAGVTL